MTWRPNFLLTWQPGTSISATVPWLKRVEDWNMLKICSPVTIYYRVINYGYSWMWMEDDEPHDCSFQSLSLRQGVTWNRYIWGKDGPCSTWSSHFAVGFRSSAPTIRPRRCWLLVAGFQWQFLAGYPNIKSNTHPDVFGWHVTHIMSWSGDIQMAVDWNPWNHLVNPTK